MPGPCAPVPPAPPVLAPRVGVPASRRQRHAIRSGLGITGHLRPVFAPLVGADRSYGRRAHDLPIRILCEETGRSLADGNVGHLDEKFAPVTREESGGPHVVYRLDPDIPLPGDAVPSGRNLRNTRFWLLLDQLLTQPTVVEAHAASEALRA